MKNSYLAMLALVSGISWAQLPNLELWNKHIHPIYYSITNSVEEAAKTPLKKLDAGNFIAGHRNINQPTVFAIAIDNPPEPGKLLDVYLAKPGKTLYMRVGLPAEKEKFKERIKGLLGKTSLEADTYIFGGQVGPLLGIRGITERGYRLKNNVSKNDLAASKVIYSPKQGNTLEQ